MVTTHSESANPETVSPSPLRLLVKRGLARKSKTSQSAPSVYETSDSDNDDDELTVAAFSAAEPYTPSHVAQSEWFAKARLGMEESVVSPQGVTFYKGLPLLTAAATNQTPGGGPFRPPLVELKARNGENREETVNDDTYTAMSPPSKQKWQRALRGLPTFQDVRNKGPPTLGTKSLLMRRGSAQSSHAHDSCLSTLTQNDTENEKNLFAALERLVTLGETGEG